MLLVPRRVKDASSTLLRLFITATALLALLPGLHLLGLYRWVDVHYGHEQGADLLGEWAFGEDWSELNAAHRPFDYRWLDLRAGNVFVAHALGGAGTPAANTLAQLQQSQVRGFRLMEIDIWRGVDDVLYCHHGPDHPTPGSQMCRFEAALQYAVAHNLWLVLDIKTAFEPTARLLLQRVGQARDAEHLVFQLYKPADYRLFVQWHQKLPLAGPLLTGYLSRRSGYHLLQQAQRLGVAAVTLPLHRLPALYRPLPTDVALLTHPVHDCAAYMQARAAGVAGMYVTAKFVQDNQWLNRVGNPMPEEKCGGAS